jgi:hypothetical protein
LSGIWWVRIPVGVGRLSTNAAFALIDGLYVTAWPWVAVLASPAAIVLGVTLGQERWGYVNVFTESLPLMSLAAVLGTLGGHYGFLFLSGFVVGDFFLGRTLWDCSIMGSSCPEFGLFRHLVIVRVPLLISYGLLAWLVFKIPIATKILLAQLALPDRISRHNRFLVAIVGHAVVTGVLVYFWVNAVPVLVRPVYTWWNVMIPPGAIIPLQTQGMVLVWVAVGTSFLRMVLQGLAAFRPELESRVDVHRRTLASYSEHRSVGRVLPPWIRAVCAAAWTTLLLAGMLQSWLEAAALGGLITVLVAAHRRLIPVPLGPWPRIIERVPLLFRLAVGILIAHYGGQSVIAAQMHATDSFRPIVLITGLGLLIFFLLNPGLSKDRPPGTPR